MKSTLSNCYLDASVAYMGVGRLLEQETNPGRIAVLEAAQQHLEHGLQMLGRLMEEEPMPTGIVDYFQRLLGLENWRSRLPEHAIADRVRVAAPRSEAHAEAVEFTQSGQVAAAGPK